MSPLRRRALLAALAGTGLVGLSPRVRAGIGTSAAARPLLMPSSLPVGSQLVALAPGTWWENPQSEAELLRQRFIAAG